MTGYHYEQSLSTIKTGRSFALKSLITDNLRTRTISLTCICTNTKSYLLKYFLKLLTQ